MTNPTRQPTTAEWAISLGISTAPPPLNVEDYDEPCPFSPRQIATRAVILQGVVAVACQVDPQPVVEWLQKQGVWEQVSPQEKEFLLAPNSFDEKTRNCLRWHQETEWALLWVVGKVDSLGLPTCPCDTRRLVDEIIPALGSEIEPFLASAILRPPGVLLAESDRHDNLWCQYFQTRNKGERLLPSDLNMTVLYRRQYAFEWLLGVEAWDDVQCDS